MGKKKWNVDSMNTFCESKSECMEYKVLDIKWIQKSYQKELWALIKCPNNNHKESWVLWNSFKKGFLCKQCYYDKNGLTNWTNELAYSFLDERGYKMINIDDWKNVDKSIWCHDKYGFKVQVSISNIKRKNSCPSPFQYNKFALDNIRLFCKLFRPDYEIISTEYDKLKSDYQWIYKGNLPVNINSTFTQTADCFINGGSGHPYFSKSNGNKIFENALILNGILYKSEKKFKECKDKALLKFDFYIPELNEVVEIDGEQHGKIIDYFGGKEGYLDRIRKDNIKNKYCEDNGIKITRIPYKTNKVKEFKKLVDTKIQEILHNLELSIQTDSSILLPTLTSK